MLLDHDGHLPVFVDFTNGDVHEVNSARRMELPRDSMVVCDRGYVDFSMLYKWWRVLFKPESRLFSFLPQFFMSAVSAIQYSYGKQLFPEVSTQAWKHHAIRRVF